MLLSDQKLAICNFQKIFTMPIYKLECSRACLSIFRIYLNLNFDYKTNFPLIQISTHSVQFYLEKTISMSCATQQYDFPNKFSNICFISLTETGKYQACQLKHSVQSLPQASLSPILTLGAFILFHHNKTQPPRFQCHDKTNGKVDTQYPSLALTVNNYHEPWNDYISNLVIQGKVYQDGQRIYFIDFVNPEYLEHFLKSQIFEFKQLNQQNVKLMEQKRDFVPLIQEIFELEKKTVPKTKKMAAVCFSSASLVPDRYMPRVHIAGLFFGQFYRQSDIWKIYKPVKGIFPTEEQLLQLDGIILSGSAYSVYEDIPEINKFMGMLSNAFKKNKKVQILGFCFGHQAIAYEFGGKVESMKKLVVHLQNIKIDPLKIKQMKLDWFNQGSSFLGEKQKYLISQFHGDAVVQAPEGFQVIGCSQSCPNQAMASKDRRIMSFQFHMEYTPEFAGSYELRLKSYDPNCRFGRIYDGSSNIKASNHNMRSVLQLRETARRFLDFNTAKSEQK